MGDYELGERNKEKTKNDNMADNKKKIGIIGAILAVILVLGLGLGLGLKSDESDKTVYGCAGDNQCITQSENQPDGNMMCDAVHTDQAYAQTVCENYEGCAGIIINEDKNKFEIVKIVESSSSEKCPFQPKPSVTFLPMKDFPDAEEPTVPPTIAPDTVAPEERTIAPDTVAPDNTIAP